MQLMQLMQLTYKFLCDVIYALGEAAPSANKRGKSNAY